MEESGTPSRAKRARGSFSQRAPREKRFDQKEKLTPINAFFRVPQANQHLMDCASAPTLRPRARSARKKISQRAKLEKIVYKKSKNKFPLIFSAHLSLHSRRSCVRCYLVTTTLTKEKAPSAHRFPGLPQKKHASDSGHF